MTDAHCHPTDLNLDQNCYAENKLGGIAAMATLVEDQDRVKELGGSRPARKDISQDGRKTSGPRVITCFGEHFNIVLSLMGTLLKYRLSSMVHPSVLTPPKCSVKRGSLHFTLLQTHF